MPYSGCELTDAVVLVVQVLIGLGCLFVMMILVPVALSACRGWRELNNVALHASEARQVGLEARTLHLWQSQGPYERWVTPCSVVLVESPTTVLLSRPRVCART